MKVTLGSIFNPFSSNAPLLYPTSIHQKTCGLFDVFWGCRSGTLVENRLKSMVFKIFLRIPSISARFRFFFKSFITVNIFGSNKIVPDCRNAAATVLIK